MENKTCINCGRELPLSDFRRTKGGAIMATCNACIKEKCAQTRYEHTQKKGGGDKTAPFSDPDLDGKDPGEVWRLMCRAEKWLNSREGYKVSLSGEYHEMKIKKLKKE